ncbi:branched-chain amino acid ABC transporter permease [Pseudonocardia sp. GCM10023141]|uniref:branched-chain amino acid ABC transporter permease n=1 Tax=Pseudonocardia sp. GCM10023141 TaxID=3252653 RepID=UPI00361C20A5
MGQQILSGLQAGSWYGVLALAVVLVLKSTDVPNFAMAATGLAPAYILWMLHDSGPHLPYPVALVIGLATGVVLALVMERAFIRPLLEYSHFATVLMTIGLMVMVQSAIDLIWSPQPRSISTPYDATFTVLGQTVTSAEIVSIVVGLALMVGLRSFFRSAIGIRLEALAEDKVTPRLLGVRVSTVLVVAWTLASLVATLAMTMQAQATVLSSDAASTMIVNGFVAATLGGFSSITGAYVGGLALGVLENLAGAYIGSGSKSAVALVVVVVVLMVRPQGLFGGLRVREV